MAELKTQRTGASVDEFIDAIPDEAVRQDCRTLVELMRRVTGSEPQMWGAGIVGFGECPLKYPSGRVEDWPCMSFAPRKRELALYVMAGVEHFEDLLQRLGKHRTGKSCLWVKRLSDIDLGVLEQIATVSLQYLKETSPTPLDSAFGSPSRWAK
jgi:hypothetical protein